MSSLKLGRLASESPEEALDAVNGFGRSRSHFYVVPDYDRDEDAERIVGLFGGLPILSGGSGLLKALAQQRGAEPSVLFPPEILIFRGYFHEAF